MTRLVAREVTLAYDGHVVSDGLDLVVPDPVTGTPLVVPIGTVAPT